MRHDNVHEGHALGNQSLFYAIAIELLVALARKSAAILRCFPTATPCQGSDGPDMLAMRQQTNAQ